MRILALDTATELCSAALLLDQQLLHREERLERGHAAAILPMVDALLHEADVGLRSLDAVAFGRGPGAFTGVRLAVSVTQGLAFGAGLPVVPVSDLQAVAQRLLDEDRGVGHVLVCADARMREVYWACFERSGTGRAQALGDERVGSPTQVRLPRGWTSATGAGSGFAAYRGQLAALPLDGVRTDLLPRAVEIAHLAMPEVAARRFMAPEQALPVYLRDDVARVPRGG